MKKLATVFLTVALMVSIMVTPAFALSVTNLEVESSGGVVTVTGTLGSEAGKTVTLLVHSTDDSDVIVYVDQGATNANGQFTFKFSPSLAVKDSNYTVRVGGDNVTTLATAQFTMTGPSGGGVTPPPTPGPVGPYLPPKAQEAVNEVSKKLEEIFQEPAEGEAPKSDNSKNQQAAKAAEDAIRQAGKTDLSNKISVQDGVARAALNQNDVNNAFRDLKEIADAVNAKLKESNENAAPVKVVATLDFGTFDADKAAIPLAKEVLDLAKEQGVDAIAVVVNGVTVEVDVDEFDDDVTVNIATEDPSAADQVTNQKRVSDVYDFTFETGDGGTKGQFNSPVTVTVPVNPTGVDTELLTLAKLENNGYTPYGGKYDNINRELVAKRNSFSTYTVIENKVTFNDIDPVQAWAGRAIEVSAAKGIIQGRGNGIYDPRGDITRAEFATLLVKTFGLENPNLTENFTDVEDGTWYQPYVAAAVNNGIINGRSATIFDPNAKVTRAEMATMAANALRNLLGYQNVSDADEALAVFKDADKISNSLKPGVALMTSEGIIKGKGNGIFDPQGNTTRAEAAVIIYALFNLQ